MKYLWKLKKWLLKDECEVQGKVLAVGTILIASAHGLWKAMYRTERWRLKNEKRNVAKKWPRRRAHCTRGNQENTVFGKLMKCISGNRRETNTTWRSKSGQTEEIIWKDLSKSSWRAEGENLKKNWGKDGKIAEKPTIQKTALSELSLERKQINRTCIAW